MFASAFIWIISASSRRLFKEEYSEIFFLTKALLMINHNIYFYEEQEIIIL